MSQDKLIKLKCSETGDIMFTTVNKKNRIDPKDKLELMKYNKKLRKRTLWKEMKK